MKDFQNHCFVCDIPVDPQTTAINKELNLPVCDHCKDTEHEKKAVNEANDSMAEGFVCGCI